MGRKAVASELKVNKRVVVHFTEAEHDLVKQWHAASGEAHLSELVRPLILGAARKALASTGKAQPED